MRYDISQHSAKGVKARQALTTPLQRSQIATKAAKARWAKITPDDVKGDFDVKIDLKGTKKINRTSGEVNSLDLCSDCGRHRYKHSKYSEIKCKGSY